MSLPKYYRGGYMDQPLIIYHIINGRIRLVQQKLYSLLQNICQEGYALGALFLPPWVELNTPCNLTLPKKGIVVVR